MKPFKITRSSITTFLGVLIVLSCVVLAFYNPAKYDFAKIEKYLYVGLILVIVPQRWITGQIQKRSDKYLPLLICATILKNIIIGACICAVLMSCTKKSVPVTSEVTTEIPRSVYVPGDSAISNFSPAAMLPGMPIVITGKEKIAKVTVTKQANGIFTALADCAPRVIHDTVTVTSKIKTFIPYECQLPHNEAVAADSREWTWRKALGSPVNFMLLPVACFVLVIMVVLLFGRFFWSFIQSWNQPSTK